MASPQEFTVTILPDGRIVLDMNGIQETSYRRILEMLQETVGPAHLVEMLPGDPPQPHLNTTAVNEEEERQLRLEGRTKG